MIRFLWFILLILPLAVKGQFTYIVDQSIPVQDINNIELSIPWSGGLNAAQYNTMDLDLDGVDDLVLFDRMANKVITFLNVNNNYVPASEYENFFPAEISSWLLLRDYNCDGKKDIFTGDVLGIKVYKNITVGGGFPTWEQFFSSSGFAGSKSPVLLTKGFNSKINLQLQFDDLPSISDLDILNVRFAGKGTIEFHQNLSKERYGTCDSLDFERVTQSWGNFRECSCGEIALNGLNCSPITGGRIQHAGGKSLLTLDLNNDQQKDLLLSEAECFDLYALYNTGTTFSPVINGYSAFPENNPPNIIFPTPYFEDVDFDGIKDLLVSPNIFTKEWVNTNLQQSNWFYKNSGTNLNPLFTLVERDFLQKSMIDVGDNAVPAFADHDGDGDTDMFISKNSSEQFSSAIYLYENTGTLASPVFRLSTDDFLGFSSARLYNVKIQLTDINIDQKTDLVFTATSLETNITNLYFINGTSEASVDFTGSAVQMVPFEINYNENLFITDVNRDGLPDILAGRNGGQLEYWRNSGITGTPTYLLEDETFLGFGSSTLRQNISCSVGDLDANGTPDLIVGDQTGRIGIISDYLHTTSGDAVMEQKIIFNPLLKEYGNKNLGGKYGLYLSIYLTPTSPPSQWEIRWVACTC